MHFESDTGSKRFSPALGIQTGYLPNGVWDTTTTYDNPDTWRKVEGSFTADSAFRSVEIGVILVEPTDLSDYFRSPFQEVQNCGGCSSEFTSYAFYDGAFVVPLGAGNLTITGPDLYCPGTPPIPLQVSGGSGYEWATLQQPDSILGTGNEIRVAPDTATQYIARCTLCNKTLADTFAVAVEQKQLPPQDLLAADTTLCPGQAIRLGQSFPNVTQYTWNGDTTAPPQITADTAGSYRLSLETVCSTTIRDTILVREGAPAALRPLLGSDTVLCPGTSVQLGSEPPDPRLASYRWSTGDTAPSLTVTQAGQYALSARSVCGDTLRDSLQVSAITFPAENPLLGPDTLLCAEPGHTGSLTLDASAGNLVQYQWFLGRQDTTPKIQVPKQSGRYGLRALSRCGDTLRDTIQLRLPPEPTDWPPPERVSTCAQAPVTIGQPVQGALSYRWNTGDTLPRITVREAGSYQVQVVLPCQDTLQASIQVLEQDSASLQLANAFTPNGDGINDYFPGAGVLPADAELSIWNRWGAEVFQGRVNGQGWNGRLPGGGIAPEGTYIYQVRGEACDDQPLRRTGSVTLLR